MAGVLFWRKNKVRNGNVDKRDNKTKRKRVHSRNRTGEWQPCPLHLHLHFLQSPLSANAMAVLFTSSPSTALPFNNATYSTLSSHLIFTSQNPLSHRFIVGAEAGIVCEPCNGTGWLVCDFCNGQKTNVKAENNKRIYRRCPSCKAVGYVLCSKCKVFKCVTFPNFNDSEN
ncbi:hypothetical protein D0Y65_009086 [Glycine soja]|uniref:Uncharacterized protein n=1 Tax=Glycine soja TaxID=3848 RepID=A0A445KX82_GLYSO|nr:hypothetical protein D0Y65_009086 [Glycine soja]